MSVADTEEVAMEDVLVAARRRGDRVGAAPITTPASHRARVPRQFRVFQVGFVLLTVEFAGLGIAYLADPAGAVDGFSRWNQSLGGIPLVGPDVAPWRYVAAIGMITVGLMCAMLLADLRRNLPVLLPATFFKTFNAAMWFWYAGRYGHGHLPVFYAAGVFDLVQVLLMVLLVRLALRSLPRLDRAS